MVDVIRELDAEAVRVNIARVRSEIAAAGRDPGDVEILAAVKYVPLGELGVLAQAGVKLVGENRAQDLVLKAAANPEVFTWDFIGQLQSRKVKQILPYVRYVHSVASESVLVQLARHATASTQVLVEVNVAGEPGKSGVAPSELSSFLARCPVTVVGLMTMPPYALDPQSSRPHFVALRELAELHHLTHLSMGTSQDYGVAVEEGATIIRLGSSLYKRGAS